MKRKDIITSIEEGMLEQEFHGSLPHSDEGNDAMKEYVDGFIWTLQQMEGNGLVEGIHNAIQEGKLISRNLGDIRLP